MKKGKIGLLVILSAVFLALTGCGKDKQLSSFQGEKITEGMEGAVSRNVSHFPMPQQYETVTIADGKIYACHYGESGMEVSVFMADTMEQTASYQLADVAEVKSITVDASDQICIFGGTGDRDNLWTISPDGESSVIENIEVEDLGSWPELKNFYADGNGFYYLWYSMSVPSKELYEDGEEGISAGLNRIYVKDRQMKTIVYEQVPEGSFSNLISLLFDEEGTPMMLAMDEEGYYMQRVRTEDKEEYEPIRMDLGGVYDLDFDYTLQKSSFMTYTKEGLLYAADGYLHLYHMAELQDEKLLSLASAGILEEDIIYLGKRGGTIEIIDNYRGSGKSEYTLVEEGESRRTQVTLGIMALQPDMARLIAEYNRYQNEVTIDPVVYVDGYDYEAGWDKLKMEIVQGKAPDLICVDGLGYESLAKAGAFADLYTLMQKDAEVDEEDFVSSIPEVYEINGKLYAIAPAFRIHTMWGAESVVNGRKGVRLEEMLQILRDNGGDINSVYGFYADEPVLATLCTFNMDKFIDWDNGTCDFTGKEFGQVMDFAKKYEGKPRGSIYGDIRNGDILLEFGMISCVEDYRIESEIYGEDIQFIGCPSETGSGTAASFAGEELAVNAKSGHQEEAWEFIKYYLQNGYDHNGFPLVKEQFDELLNASMVEETFTEDGVTAPVVKKSYNEYQNNIHIYVHKCEPGDVEAVRELVDSVSVKYEYNTDIQKIIEEEAGAYLQDQKSMEEVASIIQNRVQVYLDESQ